MAVARVELVEIDRQARKMAKEGRTPYEQYLELAKIGLTTEDLNWEKCQTHPGLETFIPIQPPPAPAVKPTG
jgi:hypothetical protein